VYSIAFLSVMACFGMGAMLLKRSPLYASGLIAEGLMLRWWHLTVAVALVLVALVGNLVLQQSSMISFVGYVLPAYLICLICIYYNRSPKWLARLLPQGLWGASKSKDKAEGGKEMEKGKEKEMPTLYELQTASLSMEPSLEMGPASSVSCDEESGGVEMQKV
jgi:hypothetical protein